MFCPQSDPVEPRGMEDNVRASLIACLVYVVVVCLTPAVASAQAVLGSLTGVVRDMSDLVLPGATVTLIQESTGATQTTVTNGIGVFSFPQLPAGQYRVTVEMQGFQTRNYNEIAVNVGQEYSLAVQMSIGTLTETIQVRSGELLVSTTTPEVNATVMQRQILDIPLLNRDLTNLINLQAGVQGIGNRANTVINGGRPTWTQVTLDGINIQDNFIRTNALDFLPNRPNSDNVAEFSITSSVVGADTAGGATFVRMITPSGTNALRGSVFESNRDAKFAANSFFNNKNGVEKPELKRNEFGGRVGGPILRDKLFFWGHYEARRQETQTTQNLTIPAHADFVDGVFRYVALDGTVRAVNVLQLAGLTPDPKLRADFLSKLPAPSNVNNFDGGGDSTSARLLNTARYRFNQTDLNRRDSFTMRFDYALSPAHRFEGIFSRFKDDMAQGAASGADRRQLAARSREPVQFRRSVSSRLLRIQRSGSCRRSARGLPVPRRDQRGGSGQSELGGRLAGRNRLLGSADVSVEGHDVWLRQGHSLERELHAGQHRGVRAGQLALEAELHGACGAQVGVLQPASRGRQPRVPADCERSAD